LVDALKVLANKFSVPENTKHDYFRKNIHNVNNGYVKKINLKAKEDMFYIK